MNIENVLQGLIGLSALGCVIYGPWQWVCTDFARSKMFAARDDLFDMARRGEISFSSEDYKNIRSEINDMIRFSHKITWSRFVLFLVFIKSNMPNKSADSYALSNIRGNDARTKVRSIIARTHRAAVLLLFMRSPFLMALSVATVVPFLMFLICLKSSKDTLRWLTNELGPIIQSEANYSRT